MKYSYLNRTTDPMMKAEEDLQAVLEAVLGAVLELAHPDQDKVLFSILKLKEIISGNEMSYFEMSEIEVGRSRCESLIASVDEVSLIELSFVELSEFKVS